MSELLSGDEWKHQREPKDSKPQIMTRAEMQALINREYAEGKMDLEDWRAITDDLSEPKRV